MTRLTADQLDLQARARELAQSRFAPTAAGIDLTEQYPWDNIALLREAGFVGMTLPRELGGQGRSYLDAVIVIEEMAKACATMAPSCATERPSRRSSPPRWCWKATSRRYASPNRMPAARPAR
jgi:alkylation response protein AidB-like acyl-CoA dehydrogenase